LVIFGKKFATKGYIPLGDFFNKIWRGEGVPGPHNHTKFRRCGFKNMGLEPPKSPKLVIFGINLPKKGYTP